MHKLDARREANSRATTPAPGAHASKSLADHFVRALRVRQSWRTSSFYLLLATPLVLLLGLQMAELGAHPLRFWLVLSLLFAFFGLLGVRATVDLFEVHWRGIREARRAFAETLGDAEFASELGARVRASQSE